MVRPCSCRRARACCCYQKHDIISVQEGYDDTETLYANYVPAPDPKPTSVEFNGTWMLCMVVAIVMLYLSVAFLRSTYSGSQPRQNPPSNLGPLSGDPTKWKKRT